VHTARQRWPLSLVPLPRLAHTYALPCSLIGGLPHTSAPTPLSTAHAPLCYLHTATTALESTGALATCLNAPRRVTRGRSRRTNKARQAAAARALEGPRLALLASTTAAATSAARALGLSQRCCWRCMAPLCQHLARLHLFCCARRASARRRHIFTRRRYRTALAATRRLCAARFVKYSA